MSRESEVKKDANIKERELANTRRKERQSGCGKWDGCYKALVSI